MTAEQKRQLVEDVDLVCWWYQCGPEKPEVIAAVRVDSAAAAVSYRAMAGEVHRALGDAFPWDRRPV